ncbi:MAG: sigma-70 family RNA polymerase sigma factor [Anaerolineaceae bacterium]|nr:sigma-70 family RNA polymerase sigma factor [Anaerolineaceae bacterium]
MTEQEAILALRRGDLDGLETLVRRYQLKAVQAAFLVTQDKGTAEEVVQNAFLRVAERIHQFDVARPFAPWFMRIVVNDAIKAVQRGPDLLSLESGEEQFAALLQAQLPSPEETVTAVQLRETVWAALEKLTPRQRAAVVLRYYFDMSEQEMATRLDVAPGTVKWRLHTARERLRQLLGLEVNG